MKKLTFIFTMIISFQLQAQSLDKDEIFATIDSLNDWYVMGYLRYDDFNHLWHLKGDNAFELKKEYSQDNYVNYVIERINSIDSLGIFTNRYMEVFQKRLQRNDKFNEAMILTDHNFGNMINSFLVKRNYMDGIPAFWPEENIFEETNLRMSDLDYVNWHKDRILVNNDSATYKIFYGEIGLSQGSSYNSHGDYHLFVIKFLKENGAWKIDNMYIKEQSKEEALKFYDENVKRQGYFENK